MSVRPMFMRDDLERVYAYINGIIIGYVGIFRDRIILR